jgi:hypothetical protein
LGEVPTLEHRTDGRNRPPYQQAYIRIRLKVGFGITPAPVTTLNSRVTDFLSQPSVCHIRELATNKVSVMPEGLTVNGTRFAAFLIESWEAWVGQDK